MTRFHRWVKFSVVGIAGLMVQLAVLWAFTRFAHIGPMIATALAVEAALLHNFVWHEMWTWRGAEPSGRWLRFWRFHAATGAISIASNTILTMSFQKALGIPLLVANVLAVGVTALLNFALADLWVFREKKICKRISVTIV
jgi:putative flippase GtrA